MPPRLLIPFLLAPALAAQPPDAWQQRVAQQVASQGLVVKGFACLYDARLEGVWLAAPDFTRLRLSGDLGFQPLKKEEAEALRIKMGWNAEPHWVLLSPKGEIMGFGTHPPSFDEMNPLMTATGWRSRWDLRAEFLRQHPDSGDAWTDELREQGRASARLVTLRAQIEARKQGIKQPKYMMGDQTHLPPEEDELLWGGTGRALDGLLQVPDATSWNGLGFSMLGFQFGEAKRSQLLKNDLEQWLRRVEAELSHYPSSENLWLAWSTLHELLGDEGEPSVLLASLEPAPHQPWPPIPASIALGRAYSAKGDWAGLERASSSALAHALDAGDAAYQPKEFRSQALMAWTPLRVWALLSLGREQDAIVAAGEAHAQAGSAWAALAGAIRVQASGQDMTLVGALGSDLGTPKASLPNALAERLKEPPLPEPGKSLAAPPLQLALLGHPAWEKKWNTLKGDSRIARWEPTTELVWAPVTMTEEGALRSRMAWGQEPRWLLLRGGELLNSGTTLPTPQSLADILQNQGQPYLEQLGAYIRAHPNQMEARLARLKLLRGRMPNQPLEATLIEDAGATLTPFHPGGGWTPLEGLWGPVAKRRLPLVEDQLRRWPERLEVWETWMDWAAVHPRHPGPSELLSTLSIWKTRIRGGAGPLPDDIACAVAKRLAADGNWPELEAWGQAFWEGGLREALLADRKVVMDLDPRIVWNPNTGPAWRGMLLKGLILPYREALQHRGRLAEVRQLDLDLAVLGMSPVTASAN